MQLSPLSPSTSFKPTLQRSLLNPLAMSQSQREGVQVFKENGNLNTKGESVLN
jgi:hypothetical protein